MGSHSAVGPHFFKLFYDQFAGNGLFGKKWAFGGSGLMIFPAKFV